MTVTPKFPMYFMLDTNCFNRMVDGNIQLRIPHGATLICTGIQKDELSRCRNPERSKALLEIFEEIDPRIELAASACFDIEGAGWDQAYWGDDSGLFEKMLARLKELDRQKRKKPKDPRNQIRDVVNAETALKGTMTLVTTDENLEKIMVEFGGLAINFQDFVAQLYPM